jgi:hypothetical protein
VAAVTGRQLIVETAVDCTLTRRPAAAFYPGHGLGSDPTNWWGPNPEAVVAMLRTVGFERVEVVSPDSWAYRLGRATKRLPPYLREYARRRHPPPTHPAQGRAVFHAFR